MSRILAAGLLLGLATASPLRAQEPGGSAEIRPGSAAAVLGFEEGVPPGRTPPEEKAIRLLEGLSPDVREALEKRGFVVVDTPGPEDGSFEGLEALVLFERPPERVYRLLAQTARQGEFRKDVRAIENIEAAHGTLVDEHRMRIMFIKIAYRIRYELDYETLVMRWSLDPRFENSLRKVEGYWELYPLEGERTLARFGAWVEVGPAIPSVMQDQVTKRRVPDTLKHTKKWVDSDGTYRP